MVVGKQKEVMVEVPSFGTIRDNEACKPKFTPTNDI
jgi:hypothetical protein